MRKASLHRDARRARDTCFFQAENSIDYVYARLLRSVLVRGWEGSQNRHRERVGFVDHRSVSGYTAWVLLGLHTTQSGASIRDVRPFRVGRHLHSPVIFRFGPRAGEVGSDTTRGIRKDGRPAPRTAGSAGASTVSRTRPARSGRRDASFVFRCGKRLLEVLACEWANRGPRHLGAHFSRWIRRYSRSEKQQ